MSIESPSTPDVFEGLKDKSMPVEFRSYSGEIKPSTWNENQGVIIYADAVGNIFITPANDEARGKLNDSLITKDESVGVPPANAKEYWEKTASSPTKGDEDFVTWKQLVEEK